MLKTKEQLTDLAQKCISKAKSFGATDIEVRVSNSISDTINYRNKQIEHSDRSEIATMLYRHDLWSSYMMMMLTLRLQLRPCDGDGPPLSSCRQRILDSPTQRTESSRRMLSYPSSRPNTARDDTSARR